MKKSIILVLFVFFSFSLTSYSKDNLNRYGQGLIQKIYQRDTKVDIINRYFNAIEDFSFHYYKVNPILLKDKISQFIKLKKVKEELVVPNLINDVDRYLNYDLIEKSRLNMFKIHLGKFLSEVMLANSFAFNITEIEFEQVKLEVPAIVEDTLKRAMSKIEKQKIIIAGIITTAYRTGE